MDETDTRRLALEMRKSDQISAEHAMNVSLDLLDKRKKEDCVHIISQPLLPGVYMYEN